MTLNFSLNRLLQREREKKRRHTVSPKRPNGAERKQPAQLQRLGDTNDRAIVDRIDGRRREQRPLSVRTLPTRAVDSDQTLQAVRRLLSKIRPSLFVHMQLCWSQESSRVRLLPAQLDRVHHHIHLLALRLFRSVRPRARPLQQGQAARRSDERAVCSIRIGLLQLARRLVRRQLALHDHGRVSHSLPIQVHLARLHQPISAAHLVHQQSQTNEHVCERDLAPRRQLVHVFLRVVRDQSGVVLSSAVRVSTSGRGQQGHTALLLSQE